MKNIDRRSTARRAIAALLLLGAMVAGAAEDAAAPPAKPCSAPQAGQFDFWVGEWDLSWGDGERGRNTVSRILGGCVVQEQFEGSAKQPFRGMSVSVYDPDADLWRQTWVDDQGGYLDFTGGMQDGRMILSRTGTVKGNTVHQRMVFYNIAADSFDWDWETSRDGGRTWELRWRIHYQRR
jgi:hypothetical protein